MMKMFKALVRNKDTKAYTIIESEYERKSDFYTDLRGNGYRVLFISTPENFDEDSAKYHERCELNKTVKNLQYASDKKIAVALGMTVKEYREHVKSL